jgi:hypothetical protein
METWSQEKKNQAVALYESGHTLVEVAAVLHAGTPTVQKYLREAGVQTRRAARRGWPQEKVQQCIDLYEQGYTHKEIGQLIGAHPGCVGDELAKAGAESNHYWSEEEVGQLVDYYLAGANVTQCEKKFHTTHQTVRHHLLARGVGIRAYVAPHGPSNPAWKSGKQVSKDGYILVRVPKSHYAYPAYVEEHRLVMEDHLGRRLLQGEVVHHKNKNKQDNSLSNLQLFASNAEHLAHELKGRCPKWTEDGKRRIAEGARKPRKVRHTDHHPRSGDLRKPLFDD